MNFINTSTTWSWGLGRINCTGCWGISWIALNLSNEISSKLLVVYPCMGNLEHKAAATIALIRTAIYGITIAQITPSISHNDYFLNLL